MSSKVWKIIVVVILAICIIADLSIKLGKVNSFDKQVNTVYVQAGGKLENKNIFEKTKGFIKNIFTGK